MRYIENLKYENQPQVELPEFTPEGLPFDFGTTFAHRQGIPVAEIQGIKYGEFKQQGIPNPEVRDEVLYYLAGVVWCSATLSLLERHYEELKHRKVWELWSTYAMIWRKQAAIAGISPAKKFTPSAVTSPKAIKKMDHAVRSILGVSVESFTVEMGGIPSILGLINLRARIALWGRFLNQHPQAEKNQAQLLRRFERESYYYEEQIELLLGEDPKGAKDLPF